MSNVSGLGSKQALIKVYIQNRPPLDNYIQLNHLQSIEPGEIEHINRETGNHWRKIFNCYAKLIFALGATKEKSWQKFRDQELLQRDSNTQLLFSPPTFCEQHATRIICGKTYFLTLTDHLDSLLDKKPLVNWIDPYFAINQEANLIVCPYFDYRQLSNQRIQTLVELVKQVQSK